MLQPQSLAMDGRAAERHEMVERQIAARGITDDRVLQAMRDVPRHIFVPDAMDEWAYDDVPLPIGESQTISQPFIVSEMIAALELDRDDRVLEVGAGSGYATAVLSRICDEVYGVERHASLLEAARERVDRLGYANVHLRLATDELGWPDAGPFDAILVSAGGERVPDALLAQLAPHGRMIIPVGEHRGLQELLRIRKTTDGVQRERLGLVSFVPLIEGDSGRAPASSSSTATAPATATTSPSRTVTLADRIAGAAEPFTEIESIDLDPLLARIGGARLVLIGEATHGTAEFYRLRARITRELIERAGFRIVALEADWPDAARSDRYVRGQLEPAPPEAAFARFPTWMWRNREVLDFIEWLRGWNERAEHAPAGIFGLDLYSMYASIAEVLRYLDRVDPAAATVARQRYACLSPFEADPAAYGLAAASGRYRDCEEEAVAMLADLDARGLEPTMADGRRLLDATANARVAAGASRYYRAMYGAGADSWNVRDEHMLETLEAVLDFHGPEARAVVWAHNSHLGDASATEMSARGEINLGQLVRERYGPRAYLIGQGTDRGTVAAASGWDEPMRVTRVRASHPRSYEHLSRASGIERFMLPLGAETDAGLIEELTEPRLERAIGVVYRPDTELQSHYFHARLPHQFDEWVWFEKSRAIEALDDGGRAPTLPRDHPFAALDR